MPEEKRVDPEDGEAYTLAEMQEFYKGKHKKSAIKAYFEECKPVKGKAKAKAKEKVKDAPQPKAKAKVKAKAKAKAPKPPKVIKVGQKIPNVDLHMGFPPDKINLHERLKGKKVPDYVKRAAEFKAKGVDEIIVFCVNDAAVMKGWAESLSVPKDGMVSLMGDPRSALTRRLGVVLKHPGPMSVLGNPRCKRHVIIVDDLEVKAIEISEAEDDPAGDNDPKGPVTAKTLPDHVLSLL